MTQKEQIQEWKDALGYSPMFTSNGKKTMLNPALLVKQNIDKKCFRELCRVHRKKDKIIEKMKLHENLPIIKGLAEEVTKCEFLLQKYWGFPQDASYHRFWEYPCCKCARYDNIDAYPYMQYYSQNCPIHGWE